MDEVDDREALREELHRAQTRVIDLEAQIAELEKAMKIVGDVWGERLEGVLKSGVDPDPAALVADTWAAGYERGRQDAEYAAAKVAESCASASLEYVALEISKAIHNMEAPATPQPTSDYTRGQADMRERCEADEVELLRATVRVICEQFDEAGIPRAGNIAGYDSLYTPFGRARVAVSRLLGAEARIAAAEAATRATLAERDGLRKALEELVEQIDHVTAQDSYMAVWNFYAAHGLYYKGPKYADELEAARAALAATATGKAGGEGS